MSAGAFVAAIANALLLVVPNFALALVCRTLTGMCMALIYPPSTKVLATWFVENRGLAMGWLVGSVAPGSAVPNLIKALRSVSKQAWEDTYQQSVRASEQSRSRTAGGPSPGAEPAAQHARVVNRSGGPVGDSPPWATPCPPDRKQPRDSRCVCRSVIER